MSRRIERHSDAGALADAAAREFARRATQAIRARGRFVVALSGGSTPRRMFARLAEPPLRDEIDWSRVHVFWGDERAVPPDHPDSNYRMASETLLARVPVPAEQIHRMTADAPDLDAAALEYERLLARAVGVDQDGPPPRFDWILLGMGADGHTASLFPDTQALVVDERWVVANPVPKLGADRMTFTAGLINAARAVTFLVAGDDKAAVLAEVLEGARAPRRLPSQLVAPTEGELVWMLDEAAAAKLAPETEA